MKRVFLFFLLAVLYNTYSCAKNVNYRIAAPYEYNSLVSKANVENETFLGDTIFIEKDLDLSSVGTIPVFNGVIIGNGHIISNLTTSLFDLVGSKGVVQGVVFDKSCSIKNSVDKGFISRECRGVIIDCINYGNINAYSNSHTFAGAFVGNLYSGKIVNCMNYGTISATYSGSQTYYVARAGGMCGRATDSNIIACSNYGEIITSTYAQATCGGLVGDAQESVVVGCVNNGKVSSTLSCSTTSGQTSQIAHYTGGIVGLSQGGIINKCNNFAEITTNAQYASGIVGCAQNVTLMNLGNYGAITSPSSNYFVCASGICGEHYVSDLSEGNFFVNCINTGALKASTGNSRCTVAGICKEIVNANVANLLNVGTLSSSASALGTSFKIEDFETDGCNLINDISSMDEANSYILNDNKELDLLLWVETVDGVRLEDGVCCDVSVQQGMAEIKCYPTMNARYSISLYQDTCLIETVDNVVSKTFYNLLPDTEYFLKVYDAKNDFVVNERFKTLPIILELAIDSVEYTTAQCEYICEACGVAYTEKGVKYKQTESAEWNYLNLSDNCDQFAIDSLYDNKEYVLVPYFVSVFGKTYEGPAVYFKTKEIIPLLQCDQQKTTSSSLEFYIMNPDVVSDYIYGISYVDAIRGRVYVESQAGVVKITKLNYNTTYNLCSYIEKNDEIYYYDLGDYNTLLNETLEPVQISKYAAMVAVVADSGEKYPYLSVKTIEYRAVDLPDSAASEVITPYLSDGKNLFMTTLLFATPGIYQYRLKSNNKYAVTHASYKEEFTDWVTFDTRNNDCDVVVPQFENIKSDSIANGLDVNCVVIQGEENVKEYGLEYKLKGGDNAILLDIVKNSKTGVLSKTFNSLVPGLEYVGKFYAKTENGKMYYSQEFVFNSLGIEKVLLDNTLVINDTVLTACTEMQLPVCLRNEAEITAFQFDLYLPEGFSIATDFDGYEQIELLLGRTNLRNHSITSMKQPDGSVRVLCYSNNNKVFAGNNGGVLNLGISVDETVALGVYTVEMRNIILTAVGGVEKYEVFQSSSMISFVAKEVIAGDVNADENIDVADVSAIVALILGSDVDGLNAEAADVNGDECIDVADISGIISVILGKDTTADTAMRSKLLMGVNGDGNALYVEPFGISVGEEKTVEILMNNPYDSFTSLQFDLRLPKGLEVVNEDGYYWIDLGSRTNTRRHVLPEAAMQQDGALRVLTYSNKNELFEGESGDVLVMTLRATEEISDESCVLAIENVVLGRPDGSKAVPLGSVTPVTVHVTGINDGVVVDESRIDAWYDLCGRVVEKPSKGLYIRNGVKVIKK